MAAGDVIKLRLESIAAGGEALGRIDGKPVFIEGGAPCETVLVRVTQEKKTWVRAQLLEIIEPSPFRVDPFCLYYGGGCGGCNLLHIKYQAQLDAKVSILKELFLKIAALDLQEIEVVSYQDDNPLEYRSRMQFHCLREKSKGGSNSIGFMGRGSKEVIPINDCPVAVPVIRNILKSFTSCASSGNNSNSFSIPPEKNRFTVFSKDSVLLSEGGITRGKIKLLDKEIILDAGVFFQSNCFMLEKLILELRCIAEKANTNHPMADLYCGIGTFAFFLGDLFPAVILAEENKTAVSIARENLKGKKADFFALKDSEWPRALLRKNTRGFEFDFAVIDPPRAGLNRELAAALAQNGPSLLAYVSCDAASLARDAKILTLGYKLKKIIFFDFYPHTSHIESMAVFEKS